MKSAAKMFRERLLGTIKAVSSTAAIVLALASGTALPATDSAYPTKPIRLVVPFAAGSATDSVGRILADELSRRLGQTVIVDNRAGAFGQIAADFVAHSAPDGYTLFMTTNTTHSANPHLYKKLPYDPIKDFDPIARVGILPFMLVINPSLPAKTTADFLAYAKANQATLSYATASSASLIGAETINHLAKLNMGGVQYKASPQAMLDVVTGRVQVMVADFATAMPQVKAGKLRVLGVASAKRSALLPEVPAIAETIPGYDITSWNGLFAPAGLAPEIKTRLARETLEILALPDTKKRLAAIGFEVDTMSTEPFTHYVRDEITYWGKLVHDAGIQPE
ncbi:MAG: tripartite tricarboxylate transporter substrate binding protein [Betaproteobacteria bacterium]